MKRKNKREREGSVSESTKRSKGNKREEGITKLKEGIVIREALDLELNDTNPTKLPFLSINIPPLFPL